MFLRVPGCERCWFYVLQNLNNKLLSLAGTSVREYETFKRRSLGQFLYPINTVMDKFMLPACLYVCTRLNLDQVNTITTLEPSPERHRLLPSRTLDKVFPELQKIDIDALMEEPMKTQLDFLKHLYRHLFGCEPTVTGEDDSLLGGKRKKTHKKSESQSSEHNDEMSSEAKKSMSALSCEKQGKVLYSMQKDSLRGRTVYKSNATIQEEESSPKKIRREHTTASHIAARGLMDMAHVPKRADGDIQKAPRFSLFSKSVEFKFNKEAQKSITIAEMSSFVSAVACGEEKEHIKAALGSILGSEGAPCYDLGGGERICVGDVSLDRVANVLYAYIQVDNIRSRIKTKQAQIAVLQQDIESDTDLIQSFTKQDY